MNLAYITHPDCLLHSNGLVGGVPHPENARRLTEIQDHLIAQGIEPWLMHLDAPQATHEQLCLAHSAEYIDEIFRSAPASGGIMFDQDVVLMPHTIPAALRAAGSGIAAVDWVLAGEQRRAFCAIRPPGHHAGRSKAAGFCLFNNVAIATAYALTQPQISRVAIIDFDVHHGDGTEDIVAGDSRILFCSSFQHPFYPYSGIPASADNCLPVPLPQGTRGDTWRPAIEQAWFARLEQFAPELIVISAGFDGHLLDDMGGWGLVEADYAWLTQALTRMANTHASGRIISLLEGGYEIHALARSVAAHITALQE
ncbi:MAG: histone deacetylase family protein [Halothiobacillus sp.]